MKRVVITGAGAISPLGHDWASVRARLEARRNAVQVYPEWGQYKGLNTRMGVPCEPFELPAHYNRKSMRSMGRVAVMATRATRLVRSSPRALARSRAAPSSSGTRRGPSHIRRPW